ncbi:MAG TPA: hypothetical protein VFD32_22000 [Dehalococcoidia bacterium]|nr:hypothetical protein [Dehalococcoidia bacterium]
MDLETASALGAKLIAFLETGTPPQGLFAQDIFCDFSMPQWRLQARGIDAAVRLRSGGHPGSSTVARHRCDPTPTGFVLEVEERWQAAGEDWYCRELFRAEIRDGRIAELSVYCTGDWNAATQAQHRSEVQLLRP